MAELQVNIVVTIDGEHWVGEHTVTVPPDYRAQDIVPFVQHEMDKAVTEMQREAFGYSRSDKIIRQFDRRLTLIKALLIRAPHDIRKRPVIGRIREIIDMDQDELFARFGTEQNVEG